MFDIIELWTDIKECSALAYGTIKRRLITNYFKSFIEYNNIEEVISYTIEISVGKLAKLPLCNEISYKINQESIEIFSSVEYSEIFISLINDIHNDIRNEPNRIIVINKMLDNINKWKYFFSSKSAIKLLPEKEIGLYGEIELLRLLIKNNDSNVLFNWNGPFKYKHDFVFQLTDVEVKTIAYSNKNDNCIYIHGVEQLYSNKKLLINVNYLKENINGLTLKELIDEVGKMIILKNREYYYDLLSIYGYSPQYEYTRRYIVEKSNFYKVKEGFPRYPELKGIDNVRYSIDVNYLKEYKVYFNYELKDL